MGRLTCCPCRCSAGAFARGWLSGCARGAPDLYGQIPRGVWETEWVVHSQAAGRGEEAVGYLARYVQSTALGGKASVADSQAGVTFTYTENGTGAHGR